MAKSTTIKLDAEEMGIIRELLLDHIMTIEDNGNEGAAAYVPGLVSAYKKIESNVGGFSAYKKIERSLVK